MNATTQNDDGTRPYLPPRRAMNFCTAGVGGTLFFAPLIMVFDILYFLYGDDWSNVFMPDGLPIGPVIFAIVFAIFGVTCVRKVYVYRTIKWIRRYRRIAFYSSFFTLLLWTWNVWALMCAPNQDVFATYLMFVIALSVVLGLAALFVWTLHKYRWYDPNSIPEEWELPEAFVQKD